MGSRAVDYYHLVGSLYPGVGQIGRLGLGNGDELLSQVGQGGADIGFLSQVEVASDGEGRQADKHLLAGLHHIFEGPDLSPLIYGVGGSWGTPKAMVSLLI